MKGSLSSYFKAIYHLFVFFVYVCKYAPDYLYSIYTCDLSPLRFAVVGRIALRFPFISRSNRLGIRSNSPGYPSKKTAIRSNGSGYPLRTVRTACQLRYCSKTISPEQFATNLSENVHNSSKRCLPSPHVLSRYIFYSIHLFFFITVDYRCRFYSKLSFSNRSCFGLFVCKYQTILVVWFLPWEYTLTGNDNILVQRVYFPLPSTVLAH